MAAHFPSGGRWRGCLLHKQEPGPRIRSQGYSLGPIQGGGFSLGESDFGRSEQLAATYQRLVTARPFLLVVQDSGATRFTASELGDMVTATTGTNPPVIDIRTRHSSPTLAAATAQVMAEQFIGYTIEQRLAEIARLQVAASTQGIINVEDLVAAQFTAVDSLSLLEPVTPPKSSVVPRTQLNVILGGLIGMGLAIGVALLLESLRDTVRFPDQLSRRFGVSGLGTIFEWSPQDVSGEALVVSSSPSSTFSEAFRQIRANFEFATANSGGKVFLVSSPGLGEGKSTILANLAAAFAQTGRRVAAVDGDLRRPSLHRQFQAEQREPGLSNALVDPDTELSQIVIETDVQGVHLIPCGPRPPNPVELLGSASMTALLDRLRSEYDLVFIDSPPILPLADGLVMAPKVDGMVIVVDGLNTRSSSLQATVEVLRKTTVKILGVIINKQKRPRFRYGYPYYYDYYYYSYEPDEASVDGSGPLYRRVVQRARRGWARLTQRSSRRH